MEMGGGVEGGEVKGRERGTGPPFPGSAIPTVRALGLGIGLGIGLGLGLGGPWEWRTPGMADRNREREGPKLLLNQGPSEPCYATASGL